VWRGVARRTGVLGGPGPLCGFISRAAMHGGRACGQDVGADFSPVGRASNEGIQRPNGCCERRASLKSTRAFSINGSADPLRVKRKALRESPASPGTPCREVAGIANAVDRSGRLSFLSLGSGAAPVEVAGLCPRSFARGFAWPGGRLKPRKRRRVRCAGQPWRDRRGGSVRRQMMLRSEHME